MVSHATAALLGVCAATVMGTVASQSVGVAGGPVPDAARPATITVTVEGLPKTATLKSRPRVQLVGPTGTRTIRKWRVGHQRTLTGLHRGLYVLSGRSVTTKAGELLVPTIPSSWIDVDAGATRRVKVRYVRSRPDDLPPNTWPVDMNDACRFDLKDPGAHADTYNNTDPYAWYCVRSTGEKTTVDVGYYCKNHEARPRNAKLVNRRWHCTAW